MKRINVYSLGVNRERSCIAWCKLKKHAHFLIASTLLLPSCISNTSDTSTNIVNHPYKNAIESKVQYAKGFRLQYFDEFKLLTVDNPFTSIADSIDYILIPKGKNCPKAFSNCIPIEIPVKKLICLSTTHIALTEALDCHAIITGLADTSIIYNKRVITRIREGKIKEVGKIENQSIEQLVSLKPDLVMSVGIPGGKPGMMQTLLNFKIPVVINSEWLENSPLGRAEWIKVLGALTNKEKKANEVFASIVKEFRKIEKIAFHCSKKPKILSGNCYKGLWYVPGGKSYTSYFYNNAGGDYLWKNDLSTGSLHPTFEALYSKGKNADFWFYTGGKTTKKEICKNEPRVKNFRALRTGSIYSNTKRSTVNGANDYWENGIISPHLILSDFLHILHPDLLPGHKLVFYEKIK